MINNDNIPPNTFLFVPPLADQQDTATMDPIEQKRIYQSDFDGVLSTGQFLSDLPIPVHRVDDIAQASLALQHTYSPPLPPSLYEDIDMLCERIDFENSSAQAPSRDDKKLASHEEVFLKSLLIQPNGIPSIIWSLEQDYKLIRLILSEGKSWSNIVKKMGVKYTRAMCMGRFVHFYLQTYDWTPEKIKKLKESVALEKKSEGKINWEKIANHIDDQLPSEVCYLYYRNLNNLEMSKKKIAEKNQDKISRWSDELNKRIIELSSVHKKSGKTDWQGITQILNKEFDEDFDRKQYCNQFRHLTQKKPSVTGEETKKKSLIKKLTPDQEELLLKLAQKHKFDGRIDWCKVSSEMNAGLSNGQYAIRFRRLLKLQQETPVTHSTVPTQEIFSPPISPQQPTEVYISDTESPLETPLNFQQKKNPLKWNPQTDQELMDLASIAFNKTSGKINWKKISNILANGQTNSQCQQRYQYLNKRKSAPSKLWTPFYIQELRKAYLAFKEQHGKIDWELITSEFNERFFTDFTRKQCSDKYFLIKKQDKVSLKIDELVPDLVASSRDSNYLDRESASFPSREASTFDFPSVPNEVQAQSDERLNAEKKIDAAPFQECAEREAQNYFCEWLSRNKVIFVSDQSTPLHFAEQHRLRLNLWSSEKNHQLRMLVAKFDGLPDWNIVAEEMGTEYSEKECKDQYYTLFVPNWTINADLSLEALVTEMISAGRQIDWDEIADQLDTGHINAECGYRYRSLINSGLSNINAKLEEKSAIFPILGKRTRLLSLERMSKLKRS